MPDQAPATLNEMTADIVMAFVAKNAIAPAALPDLIRSIHAALRNAVDPQPEAAPGPMKPSAAEIKKSIRPEGLVSFEDGKPYKMLRRHLNAHGLTVEAYKAKWGLPADYPLVAADYAAKRSALAFSTGLGRKPEPESVPAPVVTARPFPKRRPKGAIKPSEDTFS